MSDTPTAADSAEPIAAALISANEDASHTLQQGAEQVGQASAETVRSGLDTAESGAEPVAKGAQQGPGGAQAAIRNTMDLMGADGALAAQSAHSVRALSEAGAVIAKATQEASRTWMELAEQGLRTNLEALNRMAGCRSVQELVELQSELLRDNLSRTLDAGEALARSSRSTLEEVNRTFRAQGENAQAA